MSDNYTNVILEEIRSQNKAIFEAAGSMQEQVSNLPTRDEFNELKDDVKIIKAAVKNTNSDVQDLKIRVDNLEAAA